MIARLLAFGRFWNVLVLVLPLVAAAAATSEEKAQRQAHEQMKDACHVESSSRLEMK
jgi:hypothetical protein